MNIGWECPKCHRVFAPHVNECGNCAAYAAPMLPLSPSMPDPRFAPCAPVFPYPNASPGWVTCDGNATARVLDCVGRNDGLSHYDSSVLALVEARIATATEIGAQLSAAALSAMSRH